MNEQLQRAVINEARRAAEIRRSTGQWPIVGTRFVNRDALEIWSLDDDESQRQLAEMSRQVDLRVAAIHIAWQIACDSATAATLENDVDIAPSAGVVSKCLSALAVDAIDSDDQFRWELDTAAAFAQGTRVARLLRAWRDHGMPDAYLPVGTRMLFLLGNADIEKSPQLSGAWDPNLPLPNWDREKSYYALYSVMAWAASFSISKIRKPAQIDRPVSLSEKVDPNNLRELRYWIGVTADAGLPKDPVTAAICAWTTYANGLLDGRSDELRHAGRLYEEVPLVTEITGPVSAMHRRRWNAASIAYEDAGTLDDASRTARMFAEAEGKDAAKAWRRVAQLSVTKRDLTSALDALFKSFTDDDTDNWREQLIIELGSEKLRGDALLSALLKAAESSPFKTPGQRLVRWILPWYPLLCNKAQERFWFGLYSLSSPEWEENTGQAVWDVAGASFGEALAFELKDKVFAPFFVEFKGLSLDAHWQQIQDSRATLGTLTEALMQTRHGNHTAAKKLSAWLLSNRPQLIQEVIRNEKVLRRIPKLRGEAQHSELSADGVRELFDSVCQLLKAIHSKPVGGREIANR